MWNHDRCLIEWWMSLYYSVIELPAFWLVCRDAPLLIKHCGGLRGWQAGPTLHLSNRISALLGLWVGRGLWGRKVIINYANSASLWQWEYRIVTCAVAANARRRFVGVAARPDRPSMKINGPHLSDRAGDCGAGRVIHHTLTGVIHSDSRTTSACLAVPFFCQLSKEFNNIPRIKTHSL